MTFCSLPIPGYGQKCESGATPEVQRYLQPPEYRMPKDNPLSPAELLDDEVVNRLMELLKVAAEGWPEWLTAELTSVDLDTMVKILSDGRLVGDGAYYEGGYRQRTRSLLAGFTWDLAAYTKGLVWSRYDTIMRIFPNGNGVPAEMAMKTFGMPRLDQDRSGYRHLVYGNLDLLYDVTGKYLGVVFVFMNPEKEEQQK
jgi:hypothetical protein